MKNIISLLIGSAFLFATSVGFANTDTTANTTNNNTKTTKTSMSGGWSCSTNASSPSSDADKKADDKMAKQAVSASEAYKFAAKNCRDCTQITCQSKK
jgi:hypothetical protein